ncbi:type II toxin-antitoxin system RelE/ParE family toxin [Halobacillus sp. B23F22_1]|uniref:type II toxin-antitoxin system RelE/ParE family toxin n=1 Tax=Halobacillus sp. B23F22_1 TaxID=3459514 RepID=UPI00373E4B83
MDGAINDIRSDPYVASAPKQGDLASLYRYDVYHHGTNFEIAYEIDVDEDGNIILIVLAGTRENFYNELKRYWK